MTAIVLFHHAQGLTDGVRALAESWSASGRVVHTPDLYDGHVFGTLDEGIGYARDVGFDAILERGLIAAAGLPAEVTLAGISLGVMPAQKLAQTRPGTVAAVFLEACLPAGEFGDAWPASVPVQVHGMAGDPFFAGDGDLDAARDLVATATDGEVFTYPGEHHLFCDASLDGHDPDATATLTDRVLAFLERVDRR